MSTETRERTDTTVAPGRCWFNWFYSHAGAWGPDGGAVNPDHDPTPYPSRDVAEAVAEKQLAAMRKRDHPELVTYIGAFPEGERPNVDA